MPAYGPDPLGWLDAALTAYRSGRFDVLLPTQEQVAVLSSVPGLLDERGVTTVVPPFAALAAVQDKISAFATLRRLGIPQPPGAVGPVDGVDWSHFPAYVKVPIGTASGGVTRVTSTEGLRATSLQGDVVVQAAVEGPLAMCQSVFDRGSLIAFHACIRTGEGASGGASAKLSTSLPEARCRIRDPGRRSRVARRLVGRRHPHRRRAQFIDINPRLVEPENAWRAGVDLVGALLDVAREATPARQAEGRSGVATPPTPVGRPGGRPTETGPPGSHRRGSVGRSTHRPLRRQCRGAHSHQGRPAGSRPPGHGLAGHGRPTGDLVLVLFRKCGQLRPHAPRVGADPAGPLPHLTGGPGGDRDHDSQRRRSAAVPSDTGAPDAWFTPGTARGE